VDGDPLTWMSWTEEARLAKTMPLTQKESHHVRPFSLFGAAHAACVALILDVSNFNLHIRVMRTGPLHPGNLREEDARPELKELAPGKVLKKASKDS